MLNKKYLYPKEYFVKGNNELLLKNREIIKEYIDEKTKLLINTDNKSKVISEIIKDVKELIEYDMNNSSIISITIDDILKKELIQKHDIVYILGNIFIEYHLDLINNHKKDIPNIDYLKHVIDYNELYDEALTDYFKSLLNIDFDDIFKFKENRKKNIDLYRLDNLMQAMYGGQENTIKIITDYRGIVCAMPNSISNEIRSQNRKKSYLSSFVFPALIERTIIDFLRDYYFELGIKNLLEKDIETFNNDENEIRAMTQARCNGTISFFDEDTFWIIIIDMIKKYKVLNKEEIKIFNSDMTLGKILYVSKDNVPSFFTKHFKKEYLYLLERMFKFLNTRNNTMHLINTNENYLSIEFSSILLQLYWLSIDKEIFNLN